MDFLFGLLGNRKKEIEEKNAICAGYIKRIHAAVKEVSVLFESNTEFAEPQQAEAWLKKHLQLFDEVNRIHRLQKGKNYKELLVLRTELFNWREHIIPRVEMHNKRVALAKIPEAYELIGDVESRKLDEQQMSCVVKEVKNHLVIAGAGTGKTTTVIGKIKYLLKTGQYDAKDFLVLSFTNASATEMRDRIRKEVGKEIEACTFHKLGLNIINSVDGIMPRITAIKMRDFIRRNLNALIKSRDYLQMLTTYLLYNRVIGKSEFEFESRAEYEEYKKLNPPTTFKGEVVKSYGEMDIANFLFQNDIEYMYEKTYEKDTRTAEFGQYRPDFYLPEYGVYIEYYGINKNGQVPTYFEGTSEMTATERYQRTIDWKRRLHKENGTVLIECYAYEKWEGILLKELEGRLEEKGVKFCPKSEEELWHTIAEEDVSFLDGLVELFETVINLIKSNGNTFEDVRKKNRGSNWGNNQLLLNLIEPIYDAYDAYLDECDEIDFSDMINMATKYVKQGKYQNPYKYVIVDEYQDIAKARFELLYALRESNTFNVFCVGDDWQSIYRFAGSDINYILNFRKYWGACEISKIETTYRFSKSLIDVSGNFIMCNPGQIKKRIKGMAENPEFALEEIKGYTDKWAVDFMSKRLCELPTGSTVFFLGRYLFDIKVLDGNAEFSYRYDNLSAQRKVCYNARQDLNITFLTAHKSKGLQADYVFILNNKRGRMGFPSKMQDAPILELLLDNSDLYPFGEERRLFYVALTRAKRKVFLLTVDGKESEFAMELRKRYEREMRDARFICPRCGGRLYKKNGAYGEFYGCENYQSKGCKYTRKI